MRKLGPKGRASFVREKGTKKAVMRKKVNKEVKVRNQPIQKQVHNGKKWSQKYKRSIDCNNPKGFSQKHIAKRTKKEGEYNEH